MKNTNEMKQSFFFKSYTLSLFHYISSLSFFYSTLTRIFSIEKEPDLSVIDNFFIFTVIDNFFIFKNMVNKDIVEN